ncbi:MAG: nuclear transport factor 2 family protein [Flammeovirgaceae bacterium]|nr:nuclear transport factor 2 family protein [Flammeovirgaceae bacterium]
MKRIIVVLFILSLSVTSFAQLEEDAIKAVINKSYVGGIHNNGSIDDIREGFHPTFSMLRLTDNEVKPLPIEEWIASIEKARSQSGKPAQPPTMGKFISVDVTGNAAVVKLELYKENKKTFTDYLVLYKFEEGWRIVSKTYYRH